VWERDLVIDSITSQQVSVHLVLFPNRDLNGAFSSSCRSHDNVLAPSSALPQMSAMSKAQSFKAKVRSKFLPAETKERLALARSTTVDSLQLILGLFKGPADVVGVPGLKAGVEGLLFVIDVIKVYISIPR